MDLLNAIRYPLYAVLFIFGSIVGSFLNVCIWRMPRNESIIKPASHCPNCKKPIRWRDNIPILSFIFLAGRCRHCGHKISLRYPLVELVTAALFVINFAYFGVSVKFFIYTALECVLIIGTFTDLMHFIIPDEITIGGLMAGLALSFIFPQLHNTASHSRAFLLSLSGAVIGAASIYAIGVFGEFIFKKEAMGGGDVKLMAMIGSVLGWKLVLLVFFIAPFFGAFIGIYLKFVKKIDIIPYGPHLSLATFVVIMWGDKILKLLFYGLQ